MSEVSWAGRPRPLSSGLWTLLGWLRRDSSTDSLSSVGSDRTTRSFAFLPPGRYHGATPLTTPPQGPPTDSYKRRLRETKLRRQQERNLTLAGKYQLPAHENITYDAFSLPPARLCAPSAREGLRRAKSECGERVRAHVPGKRRAPPPPQAATAATLPRRCRTAKRRAPPPPDFTRTSHCLRATSVPQMDNPLTNNIKAEAKQTDQNKTTPKLRSEKSFLRQFFEGKKRNSAIESTHVKLLPSISELDRQATQLIENYKLKTFERNNNTIEDNQPDKEHCDGDMWICTNCLRKYDAEVITCFYCIFKDEKNEKRKSKQLLSFVTPTNNSNSLSDNEDKEKLKEMLKEMKNSLRKRSPTDKPKTNFDVTLSNPSSSLETPTLPIGNKIKKMAESKTEDINQPGPSGLNVKNEASTQNQTPQSVINISYTPVQIQTTARFSEEKSLNISLLNPVYIPKIVNKMEIQGASSDNNKNDAKDIKGESSTKTTILPIKQANSSNEKGGTSTDKKETYMLQENNPVLNKTPVSEGVQESKAVKGKQKAPQKVNNSMQTDNGPIKPNATKYFKRRQLINQLEKSIAAGDEAAASQAAIKLAQLRLNCSVLTFTPPTELNTRIALLEEEESAAKNSNENANEIRINNPNIPSTSKTESHVKGTAAKDTSTAENCKSARRVQVWVEDRCAARGPALIAVFPDATLSDLRREAEAALGVPKCLQRWVVRQTLALDDNALLTDLAGVQLDAPFYLCVVETVGEKAVYAELLQLEQRPLVSNLSEFECGVCLETCGAGAGVVLRECAHTYCRACLCECARCGAGVAHCPAPACPGTLQPREVRALLSPQEYESWLSQQLAAAESADRHAFHCRTRDCVGWAFCEPGVVRFPCPVCHATNCLPCQAIHEGETCEQYRKRLQDPSQEQEEIETRSLLDKMIAEGEALACPECNAIITKKWGCDFVKCASCRTEICWVTRGRRWGPKGTGDTSGGCRCGVDGKRCHPSCGYCH